MNLFGGSLGMDSTAETTVTAIDILDLNDVRAPQVPASDDFYQNPSYLRGGDRGAFYIDDIKIMACGHSSNHDFIFDQGSVSTVTPFIQMFLGENLVPLWSNQYYRQKNNPASGGLEVSSIA